MTELVFDASAWIDYLDGTPKGMKVKELIAKNKIYTISVTLAEVISKVKRKNGNAAIAVDAIASNSEVVAVSGELAIKAGLLHAETRLKNKKFSLSDAFVLQAARELSVKVVTGDYDFKGFKEAIFI